MLKQLGVEAALFSTYADPLVNPAASPGEDADSRNNRLLKSDKAEGDVEKAEEKEEKRELTQPDGGVDGVAPPKKEGEVVYAELVLNSDGVKTEVRPSADRTEYAVIVPPTAQNGEQLPPPPANNVDNREAE